VLLNSPVANELPYNDFFEYYAPDFKLHLTPTNQENQNSPEQIHAITARILSNLRNLQGAPSVTMHAAPPDFVMNRDTAQEAEDAHPDESAGPSLNKDGGEKKDHAAEFFDGEKDQDARGGARVGMDVQ
jgi:histone deacetylase 1/2